jgi:hypothetical protein
LNDSIIANGLLPRFTIIEYQGKRPRWNRASEHVQPTGAMLERMAKLIAASYEANIGNKAIRVELMPDAEACLDELDHFADNQINGTHQSVTRELWNRAHIKAAKLAALIAVGCNDDGDYRRPIVTAGMATWARAQIERDIHRLLDRFESGEIGEVAGNEVKQQNAVLRCIFEYLDQREPFDRFAKYGVTEAMRRDGVFTQSYLSRRLLKLPAFSDDRSGATSALKRVLSNLLEADDIRELPKSQVVAQYQTTARAFAVSNPARVLDAARNVGNRV